MPDNVDFQRAPIQHFPKTEDLNRGAQTTVTTIDEAFRDIDVNTIVRTSGFITQVVYTDGLKTMTVDWIRTENKQIVKIASTVS